MNMSARHIIAFLLTLAILSTAAVHPSSARMSFARAVSQEEEELKLTPEEEREARDIALRFEERLKTTNDVGSVIDEMFIQDFPERLRRSEADSVPLAFLDKNVALTMSRDELRRYYVTLINFYLLFNRLIEVTATLRKQAGEDNTDWEPEDALTPEMINVLLGDPVMAQLIREMKGEEKDERAKEDDGGQPAQSGDSSQAASAETQTDAVNDDSTKGDEMEIVKNHKQLESFTSTLEKTNELMRKRLASLPLVLPEPPDDDADAQSRQDASKPSLTSLHKDCYGYPKGTQVIHVDVLPLCLTLIKVNGQMKILFATIYID